MTALDEPITQPPQPPPPEPTPVPLVGEETTQKLVTDIADDAGNLLVQHANLLKAEVRDGMRQTQWWVLAAVVGVAVLIAGVVFALAGGVLALHEYVPALGLWACWLIVGGAMVLAGGVAAAVGLRHLASFSFTPTRTMKSLSESWSWLVKRSK